MTPYHKRTSPICRRLSEDIKINPNGDFVFGEQLTSDFAVAISILQQKIDDLLSVGVTTDEIYITSDAVDQVNRNKILLLRNDIANVGGKELAVKFGPD